MGQFSARCWCPVDPARGHALSLETHSVLSEEYRSKGKSYLTAGADGSSGLVGSRWRLLCSTRLNNTHENLWSTEERENVNFHV